MEEILKGLDTKIFTPELISKIELEFKKAVDAKVKKTNVSLVESVISTIKDDTIAKITADIKTKVNEAKEEVTKETKNAQIALVESKVKEIADTYLEDNKMVTVDVATVLKADSILESVAMFATNMGADMVAITEGTKELTELTDKVNTLEAKIKFDELSADMTVTQKDTFTKLTESAKGTDLDVLADVVKSMSNPQVNEHKKETVKQSGLIYDM